MSVDKNDIQHYEALANAIIVQAVLDYKAVYRLLNKNPEDRTAQAEAKRLKRFFHSRWYRMLTSLDADYLIRQIEDDVDTEMEAGRKRSYRSKGRLHGYDKH